MEVCVVADDYFGLEGIIKCNGSAGKEERCKQRREFYTKVEGCVEKSELFRNETEVHVLHELVEFDSRDKVMGHRMLWRGIQYVLHVKIHRYLMVATCLT